MKATTIQILMLIAISFLFSCKEEVIKKVSVSESEVTHLIENLTASDLEIFELDNCEYVIYKKTPSGSHGYGFLSHKGDCKNPIHYHNRHPLLQDSLK